MLFVKCWYAVSLNFLLTPFEYFILLTIVVNCFVLACEDHLPNEDKTQRTLTLVSLAREP